METEARRGVLRSMLNRPYLIAAVALGLALYFGLAPWTGAPVTRALIGWDAGVVLFLGLSFRFMSGATPDTMMRRAVSHDEGGHLILVNRSQIADIPGLVSRTLTDLSEAQKTPMVLADPGTRRRLDRNNIS